MVAKIRQAFTATVHDLTVSQRWVSDRKKAMLLLLLLLLLATMGAQVAIAEPRMSFRGNYWADGSKCEYGTFDVTISKGQVSGQVYSAVFRQYYTVTGRVSGGQFMAQTSSGASMSGTIGGGQLQGQWSNRSAGPSFHGTIQGTMSGRNSR